MRGGAWQYGYCLLPIPVLSRLARAGYLLNFAPMLRKELTVYSASAGSGKTFTLAAAYIARLLADEGVSFRQLLAVTFTNKATAEMKQRILQRLYDLWQMREGADAESFRRTVVAMTGSGGIAPETLARRAGEVLRQILHDYDHFSVVTIDSFFQSLLTDLAHELGLPANFKVDIDDHDVVDRAVDRLLGHLAERPAVRKWVLDYIRERIDDNRRWDVSREVKMLARNLLKEVFLLHDDALRNVLEQEGVLREYRRKLRTLAAEARENLRSAVTALDQEICADCQGYQLFSRGSSLQTYLREILAGNPKEPVATVCKYMEAPENWLRKADQSDAALLERTGRLRTLLLSVEDLRSRGQAVINSCELSIRHLNPLRLLGAIGREMDAINEENNRFMLAKTPQLFNRLVGADDASFVFEKTGTRFRHVMIDEFQDTSALQWSNFKHLLIENMASGNGCLLVGDIKQSIYRFRNGDWRILAGIGREFGPERLELRRLDTNFRSCRRIVEFNNAFFASAARQLDSMEETAHEVTVAQLYADVAQKDCGKEGGYVRVEMSVKKKKARGKDTPAMSGGENADIPQEESREEALARQIRLLHAVGVPYEEMAILVRFNSSAAGLLRLFAESHPDIPLVSDEAFLLSASPAVQLLVHALRYLCHPEDTIARSYVAHRYRRLVRKEDTPWEDVARRAELLLPEGFIALCGQTTLPPLYELCERLIRIFRLDKLEGAAPYLFSFLDHLLSFLEDNPSDIAAFLACWDDTLSRKAIPSGEMEGVRILTIHKSKGLAFHTVLLPYCDWPLEKDRRDDLLWCEPPCPPYNALPLLPVPAGRAMKQSVYGDAYREEHRQRRIENLNLLYVAFTRAKCNLLVWCEAKDEMPAEATAGDLIYQCINNMDETRAVDGGRAVYESGTPAGLRDAAASVSGQQAVQANPLEIRPATEYAEFHSFASRCSFRQSGGARDFVSDPATAEADEQSAYIDRGKMLHRVFSTIRTAADIDSSLRELESLGLANPKERESLHRLIARRLENPFAASWFDGTWQLHNECSILSRDRAGQLRVRRPDRVMTRGAETIVVDLKFGKPNPAYHEQVCEYMQLLGQMGYSHVRGYLWYVYTGDIETVSPVRP